MKHKISAKRLSDTLFEIAKNNDSIEQVKTSIIEFDNILRTNNELKSFVQSKRFSQEEKLAILMDALGSSFNGFVLGIVSYTSGIKASKIIRQVKNNFIDTYKDMKNIVSIHATFSSEVSEEELNDIQKKLSSYLNKDAELTFEVDSSLIGGARFRIDNMFLDASVKSQLKNIKSDLMKI